MHCKSRREDRRVVRIRRAGGVRGGAGYQAVPWRSASGMSPRLKMMRIVAV